jgi:hypothetical protein
LETTRRDRDGTSLIATAEDPFPNPDVRAFDISGFVGMGSILIIWNDLACIPEDPFCFGLEFRGLIDNVTLIPIPEPSTLLLLLVGLASAAAVTRGGRRSRR